MLLLCGLKIAVDIAAIINTVVAILTLILAILGVKWVYNIRQHQMEATYGFYANLMVYFDMLTLFIKTGDEMSPWMTVLGKNKDEIRNIDKKGYVENAKSCSKIAKDFLEFLSKAQNQVPPNKKKEKEWEENLTVLRENLVKIAYYDLAAYADWSQAKIKKTFEKFSTAITYIINEIKTYKTK